MSKEHNSARESHAELFVLNLESAMTPHALRMPSANGYKRYTFFVTKVEEAGRARFHSHLGFFEDETSAVRYLEELRATYPWAWISRAYADNIQKRIHVVAASGEQKASFWRIVRALSRSTKKDLPPQQPTAEVRLSATEMNRKLQCGVVLAVRRGEAACKSLAATRYTVQLRWSALPIDFESLPEHPLFSAYSLYLVQGEFNGRKWYAIKLGFFSDPIAAKTVANYMHSEFPAPSIIPVAQEELNQVEELVSKNQSSVLGIGATMGAGKRELAPDEISLFLDERVQGMPVVPPDFELVEDTSKVATG